MKEKTSIREVSRLAGVSVATVSRIINQKGRFSTATEARVREVMRQLDYVPNQIAQTMRTGATCSIGILVPDILNETYALCIRTAQEAFREKGFITMVFNTANNPDITAQCVEMMRAQRVSGILCVPDSQLTRVNAQGIPLIYLEREPSDGLGPDDMLVEADDCRGGELAAQALLKKKCRRIGVMMDVQPLSSHMHRLESFRDTLAKAGVSLHEEDILKVDSRKTSQAIRCLEEVRAADRLPDGLFTMESRLTLGAQSLITRCGLNMQLVSFGSMRAFYYGLCPVSAVIVSAEDMALQAAQLLLSRMDGAEVTQQHFVFDVSFREKMQTPSERYAGKP